VEVLEVVQKLWFWCTFEPFSAKMLGPFPAPLKEFRRTSLSLLLAIGASAAAARAWSREPGDVTGEE